MAANTATAIPARRQSRDSPQEQVGELARGRTQGVRGGIRRHRQRLALHPQHERAPRCALLCRSRRIGIGRSRERCRRQVPVDKGGRHGQHRGKNRQCQDGGSPGPPHRHQPAGRGHEHQRQHREQVARPPPEGAPVRHLRDQQDVAGGPGAVDRQQLTELAVEASPPDQRHDRQQQDGREEKDAAIGGQEQAVEAVQHAPRQGVHAVEILRAGRGRPDGRSRAHEVVGERRQDRRAEQAYARHDETAWQPLTGDHQHRAGGGHHERCE